jgi:hypoxanthine-DNA glycosylase
MKINNSYCEGLAPLADAKANVLILGSMPGRASLLQQQYYAHPRNTFWPILLTIFTGEDSCHQTLTYQQKCALLQANNIALWDVLAYCTRVGSLDAAIVLSTARANDFNAFFRQHTEIRHVFFNGKKAQSLYTKQVAPQLNECYAQRRYATLPSSSPAYAALSVAQKIAQWRAIKQ